MDIRRFNFTPVSHFVKAEPLDNNIFFFKKSFSIFKCVTPKKKNFKHNEQKGLIMLIIYKLILC